MRPAIAGPAAVLSLGAAAIQVAALALVVVGTTIALAAVANQMGMG